jgi:hypothetical protein
MADAKKKQESDTAIGQFLLSLSDREMPPDSSDCFQIAVAYYTASATKWLGEMKAAPSDQKTTLRLGSEYPFWEAAQRPLHFGCPPLSAEQQKLIGTRIREQLEAWSKKPWGEYL